MSRRRVLALAQVWLLIGLAALAFAMPAAPRAAHDVLPGRPATAAEKMQWQRDHLAFVIRQQQAGAGRAPGVDVASPGGAGRSDATPGASGGTLTSAEAGSGRVSGVCRASLGVVGARLWRVPGVCRA